MTIPYGPILIVDDNRNILEVIDITLRFKGYPVLTANNGLEAYEIVQREHLALVITDILMPKMDGYTLAHQMRKDPRTSQIPLIFISATYTSAEDKRFALNLGAVRFIEKPIDTDDFLLTIAEILTCAPVNTKLPIDDYEFYTGYRDRLEQKLRHKIVQISRTERLLGTLPAVQQPAFQALLERTISDRDEIQNELAELSHILNRYHLN